MPQDPTTTDLDFILAYETGEIDSEEELIAGVQSLIDSDMIWKLQGSWGRLGAALLQTGLCHPAPVENA